MADFAVPSFSLGIDFGPDDPESPRPDPPRGGEPIDVEEAEEGCGWQSEENEPPNEAPLLKRLRRGPRGSSGGIGSPERNVLDDDIEEFSSQEEPGLRDEYPSQKCRSVCGSSKLSLHGQRILTTQSASKTNNLTNPSCSNASWSVNLEAGDNKKMLPKLTITPLRKIQFLDSDSDDDDPSTTTKGDSDTCQVKRYCPTSQMPTDDKMKAKHNSSESLWKEFNVKNTGNFATPVFDEFCKEHGSLKDIDPGLSKGSPSNPTRPGPFQWVNSCLGYAGFEEPVQTPGSLLHQWGPSHPQPPSYQYFFHDDMRIQKLVRERFLNFVPLGVASQRRQGPNTETFDYMGQFGSQKGGVKPPETCEKSRKRRSGNRKGQNASMIGDPLASENWVNPRSSVTYPKDAGRRRVHVESHSSGHWFTQGGRKVYISKNGEELSGQAAYRCYKRETGAGFRKAKKKAAGKKKTRK